MEKEKYLIFIIDSAGIVNYSYFAEFDGVIKDDANAITV